MITNFIAILTLCIFKMKGPLPFDVYIERFPGKFTKLYHKGDECDQEQLINFEAKSVQVMFIREDDKVVYATHLAAILDDAIDYPGKLTDTDVVEIVARGLEITFEQILEQDDEMGENMRWAKSQVRGSLSLITKDLSGAMEIYRTLQQDFDLAKHSYMVMLFSLILAREVGYENEKKLLQIGLGALFHDLGQTRIDEELFRRTKLTPKEWDAVKDHPELGIKILDHCKGVTTEIRQIVLHTHEQINGRGYPNRLANSQIYPPAKIVAIADTFVSLISKTHYRQLSYTPIEALEIMRVDEGHFDLGFLESFSKVFFKKTTAA